MKSSTAPRRNAWFWNAWKHWFTIVIYIRKCKVAVAPTPNAWFCMFRTQVDLQKRCKVLNCCYTETILLPFTFLVLQNTTALESKSNCFGLAARSSLLVVRRSPLAARCSLVAARCSQQFVLCVACCLFCFCLFLIFSVLFGVCFPLCSFVCFLLSLSFVAFRLVLIFICLCCSLLAARCSQLVAPCSLLRTKSKRKK